jgi:hypothetical protein
MAQKGQNPKEEIELHPDAWDRFTDFVKRLAKAGPQHRTPKPKERPASNGRVHKERRGSSVTACANACNRGSPEGSGFPHFITEL